MSPCTLLHHSAHYDPIHWDCPPKKNDTISRFSKFPKNASGSHYDCCVHCDLSLTLIKSSLFLNLKVLGRQTKLWHYKEETFTIFIQPSFKSTKKKSRQNKQQADNIKTQLQKAVTFKSGPVCSHGFKFTLRYKCSLKACCIMFVCVCSTQTKSSFTKFVFADNSCSGEQNMGKKKNDICYHFTVSFGVLDVSTTPRWTHSMMCTAPKLLTCLHRLEKLWKSGIGLLSWR